MVHFFFFTEPTNQRLHHTYDVGYIICSQVLKEILDPLKNDPDLIEHRVWHHHSATCICITHPQWLGLFNFRRTSCTLKMPKKKLQLNLCVSVMCSNQHKILLTLLYDKELYGFIISPTSKKVAQSHACLETLIKGESFFFFHCFLFALDFCLNWLFNFDFFS